MIFSETSASCDLSGLVAIWVPNLVAIFDFTCYAIPESTGRIFSKLV